MNQSLTVFAVVEEEEERLLHLQILVNRNEKLLVISKKNNKISIYKIFLVNYPDYQVPSNIIRTNKYTWYNFFFKNLFME